MNVRPGNLPCHNHKLTDNIVADADAAAPRSSTICHASPIAACCIQMTYANVDGLSPFAFTCSRGDVGVVCRRALRR